MEVDSAGWSGDGDFTIRILSLLQTFDEIAALRVEDAPASSTGSNYAFLANEIFVTFATTERRIRRWPSLPFTRPILEPRLDLAGLEARLQQIEEVGTPDYSDQGMLQYLRTERVVQPHQTRGYKLIELVRLYEAPASGKGSASSRTQPA